jgi:signal transduction histidine kinase
MCEFIQSRVDYFHDIANLKGIEITTDIMLEITYSFSKIKLQRIVDNTISNAIKYSYDGGKIDIRLYRKVRNICFEVEDYGVGIADVKKIFSRYYREDEAKGGFGIGLNIVKDIIDEEGITLDVESKVKKGSSFSYTFYII